MRRTAGGMLILLSGLVAIQWIPSSSRKTDSWANVSLWLQLVVLAASIIVVNDTSARLAAKSGLPYINQMASYLILVLCFILIPIFDRFQGEHHYIRRATGIYLSFSPVFVLLSISYETLFYFCFSNTLLAWLLLERELHLLSGPRYGLRSKSGHASITFSELRVALGFSFFVNLAFFGTGNIASVSSFSLESVYRFTTVFDPFLMGAFLILKMLIPFFLLSATYGLLTRLLSLPPFSLFLLVLSTTDIMTLNFFFLVKDTGSWLEIGTTISHFIIASTFLIFQIILFSISHVLIGKVDLGSGTGISSSRKKDVRKMV